MIEKTYTVKQAGWREHMDLLRDIRTSVFIEEQNVPIEIEWDERDNNAFHVLAFDIDNNPVGTGRLLDSGQIGRMAVLRDYRNQGIGTAMLKQLLKIACENKINNLFLNSQTDAIGFYQRFGFVEQGKSFMEAGIEHRKMIKMLTMV